MTILDGILEDNKKIIRNLSKTLKEKKCLTMHKKS